MKKYRLFVLLVISSFSFCSNIDEPYRKPFYPYITGDAFRKAADFIHDETQSFNANRVFNGALVFVKGDLLFEFLTTKHNEVKNKYVLIVHNSDENISEKYKPFFDVNKIICCFAQNVCCSHEKLYCIPIGLENRYNPNATNSPLPRIINIPCEKTLFLYLNLILRNQERNEVFNRFNGQSYCTTRSNLPYADYLRDLKLSKFVLSPKGKGGDCHRTWEALLMGAIPIVKSSHMDPLYKGLPVLIIKSWSDVNESLLKEHYIKFKNRKHSSERMFVSWWLNYIKTKRP